MIIYNREWLDNLAIRKKSLQWFDKGFISREEHEAIKQKYPTQYKTYGIFPKIGLFIFTNIILLAAFGLFALMLLGNSGRTMLTVILFMSGGGAYVAAEVFVKGNGFCRNGVVEAILYGSVIALNGAILSLMPEDVLDHQLLTIFICITPLVVFAAIRFADSLLTLASFILVLIINALIVLKIGTPGKILLPFESMGLSYLVCYLAKREKNKPELRYWKNPLTVLEAAGLIAFYLSGNYMTIRILTESLLDTTIEPGQDIGLAPLFYAFTIVTPIVYIWRGLKLKDYIFLRLGLLLLVAGILSIKYYHSLMPPETALSLSGIVMILLAYFSIRYLKTPQQGITFDIIEQSERNQAMMNIANVAVSQVMSGHQAPAKSDNVEMGGGDFGGGGAGADF
jgi:hypothetical protein